MRVVCAQLASHCGKNEALCAHTHVCVLCPLRVCFLFLAIKESFHYVKLCLF